MGVILFTHAAGFALHIMGGLLSQLLQQLRQGPQAVGVKRRTTGSHLAKRVAFHQVRPNRWYPLRIPGLVLEEQDAVERDAVLLDYIELSVTVRMERMGDPEPARFIRRNECIRSDTRRRGRILCVGG
jgi:hypothetical protein